MTHHTRKAHARVLMDRLMDQGANASIVIDAGSNGCWWNARRSWRYGVETGRDFTLVLQDDVQIGPHFVATVGCILKATKGVVVSFFDTRPFLDEAKAAGVHWVRNAHHMWSQALLVPSTIAEDALEYINSLEPLETDIDDRLFSLYFRHEKIPVYVTAPNLVDHDIVLPSILDHHFIERSRWVDFGRTQDIDWSDSRCVEFGVL
jgi:hypothetical protein